METLWKKHKLNHRNLIKNNMLRKVKSVKKVAEKLLK